DHADGSDAVGVRLAEDESVVPVLVDPAFEQVLQPGKINQAADTIHGGSADENVGDIIMPVEVSTLTFMTEQPVPGIEADPSHDGDIHEFAKLPAMQNRAVTGRAWL